MVDIDKIIKNGFSFFKDKENWLAIVQIVIILLVIVTVIRIMM